MSDVESPGSRTQNSEASQIGELMFDNESEIQSHSDRVNLRSRTQNSSGYQSDTGIVDIESGSQNHDINLRSRTCNSSGSQSSRSMPNIASGNQHKNDAVNLTSRIQIIHDEKKKRMELYKAALSNDWKTAERIYRDSGMEYGVIITSVGETALHVAALAGHIEFVRNLARKMTAEEKRIETKTATSDVYRTGNTGFHCAVISGNVEIAKEIMRCEDLHNLAMAGGAGNYLPIYMAAEKGNEDMVRYLYDFAYKEHLEDLNFRDEDCRTLFLSLIKSRIFDVALQMAEALFRRQMVPAKLEEEALEELAQIPLNPPRYLQRCIHLFARRPVVQMHEYAVKLVELLWPSLALDEKRVTAFINSPDPNPILEAAKLGNFYFLSILISSYPDLLFVHDHNKYSIIHHAILNRHADILKFIHIGSAKNIVTLYRDREGNNMLHLAAKLAPPNRLNVVPGAALQLQRELLWFEEVKKAMEPHEVKRKKYYSSDFPLDQMLMLVQEMKMVTDEYIFPGGFFEKLRNTITRQIRDLKEYHPRFKGFWKSEFSQYILMNDHKRKEDMKSSMNQSDVVLLYKKLKKVKEEEYDEFVHFTEIFGMVDLFQEIKEVTEHGRSGQMDYDAVFHRIESAMRKHNQWKDYIEQQQLLELFQKLNDLMDRHELKQSLGTPNFLEDVRILLTGRPRRILVNNTQMTRVQSMVQDIERLVNFCEEEFTASSKFKELMKEYNDLREYPPHESYALAEMLFTLKKISDLVNEYKQNRDDGQCFFGDVYEEILVGRWKHAVDYKRLMDLFQDMEKVMERHIDKLMVAEYTPHDVFVEEHKDLMAKGEKWMRDTANSCMIVAVLITTIAFAAAITVPGGNGIDGYPNFSSEILFKAFAIADSVSMISSAISLLNFLSILTARYAVDDFRWSLPNKLFIGLLTIFISIVAMMVAFILSIFIIFNHSRPVFTILVAAASSAPVTLFLWQHLSLFIDVFRSTYASYFLFKPKNDPSLLFKLTSLSDVELKKTV